MASVNSWRSVIFNATRSQRAYYMRHDRVLPACLTNTLNATIA
jgi:hypothetical protein